MVEYSLSDGYMGYMSLKDIIKDSINFAFLDGKSFVFLSLFFIFMNLSDSALENFNGKVIHVIILFLFSTILFAYEEGYSNLIFTKTIEKKSKIPNILNFPHIIYHGIKEIVFIYAFYLVYLFFLVFLYVFFEFSNKDIFNSSFILVIFLFFINLFSFNIALNDGKLYKALINIKDVVVLTYRIGFRRLILACVFLLFIGEFLILDIIELPFIYFSILFLILIIMSPILLLFTKRFIALSILYSIKK